MTRRRAVFTTNLFPVPERPMPTYPEYPQLLTDAKAALAADHGFVDPVKMRRERNLGRGPEWRARVLGHDYGKTTVLEMHILLLAHERDLQPPLPQWLVDAREQDARRAEEQRAAQQRRDAADQAAWDEARQGCPVKLTVLRNGTARARHGRSHQLGHAVPAIDCRSGAKRRHRAGRALCESETRDRPLDLSGGEDGPATCASCLTYTTKIRPAAV